MLDSFETSRLPTPLSTLATRDLTRPTVALIGVGSLLVSATFALGEADTTAGSHTVCSLGSTRRTMDFTIGALRAMALAQE